MSSADYARMLVEIEERDADLRARGWVHPAKGERCEAGWIFVGTVTCERKEAGPIHIGCETVVPRWWYRPLREGENV